MTRADTLSNGYRIFQDDEAFCFGADSLLLCAFAKIKKGQNVIDLGTGNAVIPLVLQKKSLSLRSSHAKGECHFTGLEIQERAAALAKKSVAANGLEKSIDIVLGDIRGVQKIFSPQAFDAVLSNPPYLKAQGSVENERLEKRIARHEIFCPLESLVQAAAFLLKDNGTFFMVHRPRRLQEIFDALSKSAFAVRRARFVHPSEKKPPEMVLLEAKKKYKKEMKVEPPLFMYEGGEYSKEFLSYTQM